jgi:ribonuclease HIII
MDDDIYNGSYSYEKFIKEKYIKNPQIDAIDIITDDYIIVSDKIKYINKIDQHENKINLVEKRIETQNICIGALSILSCYLLFKK